jgi:WD40 repeat protein
MRRAKLFLSAFVLMLFLALPPAAFAKAEDDATIKIVPQYLPYGGIEVAAWTRDDRYVITAAGTSRTVLIWDVARSDALQRDEQWAGGAILNRLTLPIESTILKRRFTGITVANDGRSATISGEALKRDGKATFVRYRIDLDNLEISALAVPKNETRKAVWGAGQESAILALEVLFERAHLDRQVGMTMEQAEKLMPELPLSHVGKRRLVRMYNYQDPVEGEGVGLKVWPAEDADPMVPLTSMDTSSRGTNRVAVSRDGTKLAFVGYSPSRNLHAAIDGVMESAISVMDLANGSSAKTLFIEDNYQDVQWVTADTLTLIKRDEANASRVTSVLVSYTDRKPTTVPLGSNCYQAASGQGQIFAAGLSNCSASVSGDRTLKKYDVASGKWAGFGKWQPETDEKILALAVSPSGGRLALSKSGKDGLAEWIILDGQSGDVLARRTAPNQGRNISIQLPDDETLVQTGSDQNGVWRFGSGRWQAMPDYVRDAVVASDGQTLAVGAKDEDLILVYDAATGQRTKSLEFGGVLKSGFVPQRSLFWAMSATDGLRFWNSKDWSTLFSIPFFYPGGLFAIDPKGRYDSTFGDEPGFLLRWLASDDPYLSLGFQTFFRDFYEPGLVGRILNCQTQGTCAEEFGEAISVTKLNRVLPDVKIAKIENGANPHEALVTVEVREGEDTQVPNGKTRSGAYDLRLFLDGKLVTQIPEFSSKAQIAEREETMEDWRMHNRLIDTDGNSADGIFTYQVRMPVPTMTLEEYPSYQISAYAFNEDRMKSETAIDVFNAPKVVAAAPPPVRWPRAYLISIGIDAYKENRLTLDYAAADAKLFSDKLNFAQIRRNVIDSDIEYPKGKDPRVTARLAPFDIKRTIVAGEKGGKAVVTAKAISTILEILSGKIDKLEGQRVLAGFGIDGSNLDASTPDDMVVVTFSGHGWAKKNGEFFLVPADAIWPEGDEEPVTASLISAAQLSGLFRPMQAKDIIFIIDACHSAASVDNGKFKPGPLGDPGLGQLAYDKGIRILAATQADDVALEDGARRHGLLSFALAGDGEGLSNPGGLVDMDDDGTISVNEWLSYAAWRLPRMNNDKRVRNNADEEGESGFRFPSRSLFAKKKVQSPSLFDFRGSDEIILVPASTPLGVQVIKVEQSAE